jgi:hypothetical protein
MDETMIVLTVMGIGAHVAIFGGYGAYAAVHKYREWYEGFWAGVFMGPFGPIFVACLPTLEPKAVAVHELVNSTRMPMIEPPKVEARFTGADPLAKAPPVPRKRYTDEEWARGSAN